MKSVKVKISQIQPNPDNPRVIRDGQFDKLVKSITEFPQMLELRPIVVDENLMVLGGNMRLRAAQKAGLKELPVLKASELSEEQKQRFIIADNVGFGDWDWDKLANEWDAQDLVDWGLDVPTFDEQGTEEAEEDNYEVPETINTDIEPGDLFEIGPHRLLCGDSRSATDVGTLMDGMKADMAHNDPPYGMKKESDGVLNDNLNYEDLLQFNREWVALQFAYLKDNGSFYCWGTDEPIMDIYAQIIKPYIKSQKATFRNLITWDKGVGQGQMSGSHRMYPIADEKCLFVMCGVQGFNNNSDNYFDKWESVRAYIECEIKKIGKSDKQIANDLGYKDGRTVNHWWSKSQWAFPNAENYHKLQEYCKKNKIDAFKKKYEEIKKEYEEIKKEHDEVKKEYYATRAYFDNTHTNQNNVWHFERTKNWERENAGGHATPKPIALCERAIKSSCHAGGIVLDFFLGSGSTMVAAHQIGRKCYGIELEPRYCQVVIDRMLKLDPALKITRNGKSYKKQA